MYSRSLRLLFAFSTLLTLCTSPAFGSSEKLILIPDATNAQSAASVQLLSEGADGCDLLFELPQLDRQTIPVGDEVFEALTIPRGGLLGADGQPGLPTWSGMIAVPAGLSARVSVKSVESRTFENMRLFPVQPEGGDEFVIDRQSYLTPTHPEDGFKVTVGKPAIYLGQPVVSFRIEPVRFLPGGDQVEIASRLELAVEFIDDGKGVASSRGSRSQPASFLETLGTAVVNPPSANKANGTPAGPGTYLVITTPAAGNTLDPLLDWRRRQGYNVIVTSTATIGYSSSEVRAYLRNLYPTLDPPLEYVLMVGDATGSLMTPTNTEYLSGYNGEGDHYYTTLDGDDILADCHIGRLTARDPTELALIVNKILTYEINPPMDTDPGWFKRASLVGDPADSGITTIYVNQWLKAQLEDLGYASVDTIFSGNYPLQMLSSIGQGVSAFGYRGFYAMSGFSTGHIANLSNGFKLPFAVLPTCDTGSFRTHVTTHSEAFLRAPNGGAIGAIALSTVGTHTRYNNCLYNGIWEGALNTGNHQLGAALTRGKLELYNNYYLSEPNSAEIWAMWANLMGDPATDMWQDIPTSLEVDHPQFLPFEAGSVVVTVSQDGLPVEGALVALYKAGEVRSTGFSDHLGYVNLTMDAASDGDLLVTVSKHNHLPYTGSVLLGQVGSYLQLAETTLEDGSVAPLGNGDGLVNPGETITLQCALNNLGSDTVEGATATLISRDPLVTILDGEDSFGDIDPGQIAWGAGSFQVLVSDNAADQHSVSLELVATNGSEEWTSALQFVVKASSFAVMETVWDGPGAGLDPGEYGNLSLTLMNDGSEDAGPATALLSTSSPWVLVTDGSAEFPALPTGSTGSNDGNPFALQVATDCYPGHLASFQLQLIMPDGLIRTTSFQMTVGFATVTDPLGPDSYGYVALDNSDLAHQDAPVYDWVELDPDQGGPGIDVGLEDFGFEQDDTRTLDLPFSFQYYGESFDQISICSNGWISMGSTSLKHYRNFAIPNAGSPDRMIAVLWDNLRQGNTSRLYYWYDEAGGRLVIQWNKFYNPNNFEQTFEAILYDPAVHPTGTGDGKILMQYNTVNNNDAVNGYATVGIQNLTGDDGLEYTYWNQYPSAAAILNSTRAILFTPLPEVLATTCEVSPSAWTRTMGQDQQRQTTLTISNNGEPGSELLFQIEKVDPNAPVAAEDKNLTGSTMVCATGVYPIGEVVDLQFMATNNSPDNEYLAQVTLGFPPSVTLVGATNLVHSGVQTLMFNGASGSGIQALWGDGFVTSGNTATTTVTLDFSLTSGAIELPYTLTGDYYGGDPHVVQGIIQLFPSGASVTIMSPNDGDNWVEGQLATVEFLAGGGPELLKLELDRNDGAGWQTLATDIPVTDSSVQWLVEGPLSAHCQLRMSDQDNPEVFDLSNGWFSIGRDLSWLGLSQSEGLAVMGNPQEITLTIDTENLALGSYAVDLVVRQMASGTLVVPVRLVVTDDLVGITPEVPLLTRLEQNHPNPFNPQTEIRYSLKNASPVKIRIYNTQGRLVRTLVDAFQESGRHQVVWMGRNDRGHQLSSGMYFCRMETKSGIEVRKMVLVK